MKGVGQKCGQKGSELIAQAIAFVTWFWGAKKGGYMRISGHSL